MNRLATGVVFISVTVVIVLFILAIDRCVKRKLRRERHSTYSYRVLEHNDSSSGEEESPDAFALY